MKKTAVVGTTAVVAAVAGFSTTFWAEARLAEEGAWSESGVSAGHLDFTVAVVLLVGATLVVLALILALALAIEAWLDGENRRDARAAERRALRRAARDRARASVQEKKMPPRDDAQTSSPVGVSASAMSGAIEPPRPTASAPAVSAVAMTVRNAASARVASLTASAQRRMSGLQSDSARGRSVAPETRDATGGRPGAGGHAHAAAADPRVPAHPPTTDRESTSGTAHRVAL